MLPKARQLLGAAAALHGVLSCSPCQFGASAPPIVPQARGPTPSLHPPLSRVQVPERTELAGTG